MQGQSTSNKEKKRGRSTYAKMASNPIPKESYITCEIKIFISFCFKYS